MSINLSQKEKMLLNDQKNHEQLCIKKYNNYANQAQDQQLKQMFNDFASQEEQHLNSINQILSGNVPQMGQSQQQGQSGKQNYQNQQQNQQQNMQANNTNNQAQGSSNHQDAQLCSDLLMTEKFVSESYDDAIFACSNSDIRQVLNHIQKEEQQHGQGLTNYLANNGQLQ